MTALSLTYTLSNGTTNDADQVEQDFVDIRDYINAHVIRTDGANAMTAALSLSGNPTSAAHAVRKAYMDGAFVRASGAVSQLYTASTWTTQKFASKDADTATAYVLATGVFTAPTTGIYHVSYTISPNIADGVAYALAVSANGVQFSGPKLVPSEINDVVGTSNLHMSCSVLVSAGQTILPQAWSSGSTTKSLGTDLSIAWLHG